MEDNIKEEWKPYTYGNLNYLVSNFGNIIGCGRNKKLKTRSNEDGYMYVTLGDMNHRSTRPVHRIVAELFVYNDDPENKVEVNHKDFNRMNPRFDNLEWTTHKENIDYSINENYKVICDSKTGLKNGRCKFKKEEIVFIRKMYDKGNKVMDIIKMIHPDYTYKQRKNVWNLYDSVAKRKSFKDVEEA